MVVDTRGLRGGLFKMWSTCAEGKKLEGKNLSLVRERLLKERSTDGESGLEKQQMSGEGNEMMKAVP